MSESASNLSILVNMITSPQQAFKSISQNYSIMFPLLTIIILHALVIIALYANIDYQWFIDYMVEAQAGELSKADQNQARQAFEMMSANVMGSIGVTSVTIILMLVFCIMSLYFVIVSGITNDGLEFKQWLSFVCWSSIPSLIGILASLVFIFTSSNGQIPPDQLNPLSLNELFFGFNALEGAGNILASTDISVFWIIALMTIGYSQWSEKSLIKSFLIVILPYVLYYGIRFLML